MPASKTRGSKKELMSVEENAVRYTAGFLIHKLLQGYKQKKIVTACDYIDCLNSMTSNSGEYEG